jgi:glutathione S-transferase
LRSSSSVQKEPLSMLHLWGRNTSFNVQKVTWFLGELGLDYTHTEVGGRFGGLDDAAFAAKNPHAKVPVLEDGDLTMWESHTCLRYLAAYRTQLVLLRPFLLGLAGRGRHRLLAVLSIRASVIVLAS